MPFADPVLGRYLLSRLGQYEAVVPLLERGPEPVHAVYRKSCLTQVESGLKLRLYRMQELLDRVRVLYIPERELRQHDPQLRSFVNINTREDYARALQLLEL
jgi:molybdopterin-guanine dinucleotide biosynthesis protein A